MFSGLLAKAAILAAYERLRNFADQELVPGVAHFSDVLSNFGFALVALWGGWQLATARQHPGIANGWAGYRLFLIGLFLTAIGPS
ncbi:hypothetical protein [Propionivibrio sp.]|uniref:hypothetical protein n=1 Tax=Propionivibrio sp. TaxID=2212460 RepID=UPI003BF210A9